MLYNSLRAWFELVACHFFLHLRVLTTKASLYFMKITSVCVRGTHVIKINNWGLL